MINEVVMMGRLAADPEKRTTSTGKSVCRFTIAVDRAYSKEEKKADFFPAEAWEKTAEFICDYFHKGDMIAIVGELRQDKYEKDGVTHIKYAVLTRSASFCGGKGNNDKPQPKTLTEAYTDVNNDEDEGLPF